MMQLIRAIILVHNSVNCDRPGECSPEKDCLR